MNTYTVEITEEKEREASRKNIPVGWRSGQNSEVFISS
jgi:hypothetical protein